MKYIFFLIMLMIQGIISVAQNAVPAIVLVDETHGHILTVHRNSYNIIIQVDGDMRESPDGEYVAITEYLFTGVYIQKEGDETLYLFPTNAKKTMLGTKMLNGTVVGLYCPLIPKHVVF